MAAHTDGTFNDNVVARFSPCVGERSWSSDEMLSAYQVRIMQIISKSSLSPDQKTRLQQYLNNDAAGVLEVGRKEGYAAANSFVDERVSTYHAVITKPAAVYSYMRWLSRTLELYLPVVSGGIEAHPHITCGILGLAGFGVLSDALLRVGPLANQVNVIITKINKLIPSHADLQESMNMAETNINCLAGHANIIQACILTEAEATQALVNGVAPQLTLAGRVLALETAAALP